jgi:multisubunit Na+/H+ antiporter MnhB subunit
VEAAWSDPRLAHQGPGPVYHGIADIWQPNLLFTNGRQLTPSLPDRLEVLPGGEVRYRQRFWGEFSQPMDLRAYPWDTQRLTIQLITSDLTPDQVDLVPTSRVDRTIAADLSVADFDITGWEVVKETWRPTGARRDLASVRSTFIAERKTGYFTVKVIIPLTLILMMSWLVFWLDPAEGGAQIGVATTSMLTLIAFRFAINDSLPKISYLTQLDTFILASTVLVFLSLIEVTVTTRLARIDRLETALLLDRWSRLVFPVAFGVVAVFTWGP